MVAATAAAERNHEGSNNSGPAAPAPSTDQDSPSDNLQAPSGLAGASTPATEAAAAAAPAAEATDESSNTVDPPSESEGAAVSGSAAQPETAARA